METVLKFSDLILQQPYTISKADSGGMIFFVNSRLWEIFFIEKDCPHRTIYRVRSDCAIVTLIKDGVKMITSSIVYHSAKSNRKCWLTWYNDTIRIGFMSSSKLLKPFLEYEEIFTEQSPKQLIGFIKFSADERVNFTVESSPVVLDPFRLTDVKGGQLRWVKMMDDKLPPDALIGGFENEPLYIIRAQHGRSMCPGKYIASKNKASIPWGHIEHQKKDFEILCGYDAIWVKCKDNLIPENVFKAGTSEVRNETVYVGRAMIDDDLVVGKVHMLYKTCYLPYKGKEVEKHRYEILVHGDKETYGVTRNQNCSLNPLKALQPCIY